MPDITFADAELVLRDWLTAQVETPVYAGTTPAMLPTRSIAITRVGGVYRDKIIDEPRFSVDCRSSSTPGDALEIIQEVRHLLLDVLDSTGSSLSPPIYQVTEITGPYLNPDPRNINHHRFTMSISLLIRAITQN